MIDHSESLTGGFIGIGEGAETFLRLHDQ